MRSTSTIVIAASLLISLVSARHLVQEISFSGSGCGDVPPGPPTNLKAEAGNRQVKLTWDKPSNGGCVDEYNINVKPVGQASRTVGSPAQSTPDFQYTVTNLENGQEYEFTVTAISNKYADQAKSSSVKATPTSGSVSQLCLTYIYPTQPANLRVVEQTSTSTKLCWDPPASGGCVDTYNLNVEPLTSTRTVGAGAPIRIQSTRCYTVQNLNPGTRYRASVQAYSDTWNGGGTATLEFTQ